MKWMLIVFALLVGIGAGIAYEKSIATHTPIYVRVGGVSQKALLNPQPGDVIYWLDKSGGSFHPNWIFGSPCDQHSPSGACLIAKSADHKTYAYDCGPTIPCDPEVPIGSDVVVTGQTTATASGIPPEQVFIGCKEDNTVGVRPDPAPVSKAAQGATDWKGVVNATQWTVDNWRDAQGHPATVCKEASITDKQPVCTLDPSVATGVTFTYRATANACSAGPTGDFHLTVNP